MKKDLIKKRFQKMLKIIRIKSRSNIYFFKKKNKINKMMKIKILY
jgi:hypothetical protein